MRPTCYHCGEGIEDDAIPPKVRAGMVAESPDPIRDLHLSCAIRMAVGSVGHQLGLCRCPGRPGVLQDPPGLSRHEAARMAKELFEARQTGVFPASVLAVLVGLKIGADLREQGETSL